MNATAQEFENQKMSTLTTLRKLQKFLDKGKSLGINLDPSIALKVKNVIEDHENMILKVALIGGFSEGKTSLAALWSEKYDPHSMKIAYQESSDEVVSYNIDNKISLVDTPGLFGYKEKQNNETQQKEKYREITKKYVSEAHLILYVMNPSNPIKESHKEELHWLFKQLNLLPRTIFVLNRFDEVADIEDEILYNREANIKRNNVIKRLKDFGLLTDDHEALTLPVVAISANPFNEGLAYWLSHLNEFKALSHIALLQKATEEKIKSSRPFLIAETQKSVIHDIIIQLSSIVREFTQEMPKQKESWSKETKTLEEDLASFKQQAQLAKASLHDSIKSYFTRLITEVDHLTREEFSTFVETEIGEGGYLIEAELQKIFEKNFATINQQLMSISTDLQSKLQNHHTILETYAKKGISSLVGSKIINSQTILATRDGIVAVAKWVGVDLAQYLKFKPWGAVNLAKGINATLAIVGLALELWDTFQEHQKNEAFQKAKAKIKENLQKQRKELLDKLYNKNQDQFFSDFFPMYVSLQTTLKQMQDENIAIEEQAKALTQWIREGEIIEAEIV